MVGFNDVEAARRAIRDHIYLTPLAHSVNLSAMADARIFLKLENLQMTGSFKERGALNRLLQLSAEERAAGVIASSAGNHAQGVAFHATRLGISSKIVMPTYTPLNKVTSTRRYGAEVVLHGLAYDDAYDEAMRLAAAEGRTFIHPFDDPHIIAGQGTVGLELLEQNPYLDAVVVPVGGGGLIGGVAMAIKETNPRIKVYGVEAAAMPAMKASLAAGRVVQMQPAQTLAEGIAVRRMGDLPFALAQKYVDDVVTVDDEEIASAVLTLLEVEKTVVEGAGATTLAAVLEGRLPIAGRKVALVLTGGNIDVNVLSRIIRRGLAKDGRMAQVRATLTDRPGALAALTQLIAQAGANIVEIEHYWAFTDASMGEAEVVLTLEARGREHLKEIVTTVRAAGINLAAE